MPACTDTGTRRRSLSSASTQPPALLLCDGQARPLRDEPDDGSAHIRASAAPGLDNSSRDPVDVVAPLLWRRKRGGEGLWRADEAKAEWDARVGTQRQASGDAQKAHHALTEQREGESLASSQIRAYAGSLRSHRDCSSSKVSCSHTSVWRTASSPRPNLYQRFPACPAALQGGFCRIVITDLLPGPPQVRADRAVTAFSSFRTKRPVRSARGRCCPPEGLRERIEQQRPITTLPRPYSFSRRIPDQFG